MGNDPCADGIEPCVAVGMIEMPVRIDQMGDGIGAEAGKRLGELGSGYTNAAVGQALCRQGRSRPQCFPPEPSRTLIPFSQRVRDDGRDGRAILDSG